MEFIVQLWLPVVVSAVAVFVVSSIVHMALPIHKNDIKKMESEDAVLEVLRSGGVGPGAYMFPGCHSMKDMETDEYKAKLKRGPVGWLTVLPEGGFNMGRSLVQWFLYTAVVGLLIAYVAWHALPAGSEYLRVFQITGTIAFLTYGIGSAPESIWKGVSWKVTGKFIFDGLLYALTTGGVFGWLWPAAEAVVPSIPAG